MNYTTNRSIPETKRTATIASDSQCCSSLSAEGTLLTNYKKDVDIHDFDDIEEYSKIVHYGLSLRDINLVKQKLQRQKGFLDFTYLYDRINQNHIPLSDLIISVYHSPERYYAQTQNRVNTLEQLAKQRGLKPIFMTLTLPSEYHEFKSTKQGKLVSNKKYNGMAPKESVKVLTKMFARLRQDRALKDLKKENRIYFRVNEPHKDGTPHTHILMFVPEDRIERVKKAYERLYDSRANDIQVVTDKIDNSVAYVMKYINKVLPLSKKEKLSEKEEYLNAWYSRNRVVRFSSSKTLAPLSLYKLLHKRYSMYALTKLLNEDHFDIYVTLDTAKIVQIIDEYGEMVYMQSDNYTIKPMGSYSQNNSQTSDSALGRIA